MANVNAQVEIDANTTFVDIIDVIANVFNFIITIVSGIVVVFFIIAAVKMSLAQGDPKSLESAKWTFIYAFLGMMVVIFYFIIVTITFSLFGVNGVETPNAPFNQLIEAIENFNDIIFRTEYY